jgi:EmrB/QacA subfamily drug resistance transporter
LTFAGVILAMFLGSLDQTIISTAMPRIIADLGGFNRYTWISSAYIIASAVVMPITGRLTDMYGRKMFYLIGMAIFLLSSFACGLSRTMTQLIISRAVKGLGAGIMLSTGFAVIGDLFPPAERGKYIGMGSAIFGISSVIGPTLGGVITDKLSWQWVFYINVPLCVVIIGLFMRYFPPLRPHNQRHRIDMPGIVTLVMTIVPIMLALTWGGVDYPWDSFLILGMFAFSIVMLICFLIIERRSVEPIIPLIMFKNPIVAISLTVTLLTGFGMYGSIIFIPLFFQGVLGVTATVSGNFLSPMMLGMVLGSFVSGQFLSRFGGHYKRQGIIGLAILIAGLALICRMGMETRFVQVVLNITITGIGLGAIMPLYTIAVQNAVSHNLLGVATSSTAFFRSLGGVFGLAVLGSVMNTRFYTGFMSTLPEAVKNAVPMEQLMLMAHNPQALVNPERQAQLKAAMLQLGTQGGELFQQLIMVLRQALQTALSHAFCAGLAAVLIAFILNLFLKEIPLQKASPTR